MTVARERRPGDGRQTDRAHTPPPDEAALWGYWEAARLPPSCRTTDGALLEVIYRGQWSYGYGPDYKAAVLCFAHGPTVRGDVELHARSSDWRNHAHDGNPMYDDVILHVVWIDDEPCLARGRVLELSAWPAPGDLSPRAAPG